MTAGPVGSRVGKPVYGLLASLLLVACFAPLIANDAPLAARIQGTWISPALADVLGDPPLPPEGHTWVSWCDAVLRDAASDQADQRGDRDTVWRTPWPHGPTGTSLERRLRRPCLAHPFGTDDTGRDVLARVLHGTRSALGVGLGGAFLALLLGLPLGLLAGMQGGWLDRFVMRLAEMVLCLPGLLWLLAAAVLLGRTPGATVLVLGGLYWVAVARVVRGELLTLGRAPAIQTATQLGVSRRRILSHHMAPQVVGPVATIVAFLVARGVVVESTLSFLGLGPMDQAASWGAVLAQGLDQSNRGAWHLWVFPSLAILTVVLPCQVLAERVRLGVVRS